MKYSLGQDVLHRRWQTNQPGQSKRESCMIVRLAHPPDWTLIVRVGNLSKKRKSKYLLKNIANSTSKILAHYDVFGGRTLILFIFISHHRQDFIFKHLIFSGYSSSAMIFFFFLLTDNNL